MAQDLLRNFTSSASFIADSYEIRFSQDNDSLSECMVSNAPYYRKEHGGPHLLHHFGKKDYLNLL